MKKILITIVFILVTTTLGGCSMFKESNEPSHEEMVKIVRSDEVKKLIEGYIIKNDDSYAFTEKGKIKKYTIKEDEIKWNPMGGITVNMYLNDNEKYRYNLILLERNDKIDIDSSTVSKEVQKLIEGE